MKKGKIIRIKKGPYFKHLKWWVDVIVLLNESNEKVETFVVAETKLNVLNLAKIDNNIDVIN